MTILNKVQYFQNKCGCNKTLSTYTQKKKKKNNNHHQNYDNIKTMCNRKIVEKKIQNL